jgi:phenylacetic acid degradation protein paaN
MSHPLFARHQDLLASAVHAIKSRGCWSPYPESTKLYGENAVEAGAESFAAYRDAQFYLDQPGVVGRGGGEQSPWGLALNVSYPKCGSDALIAAARTAMPAWGKAGADTRAGVCAEALSRLNAQSMEMAHAVMHTTGQSFSLAFRYGGPNAQARGLEAVAQAWREMKHVPYRATWEKAGANGLSFRAEKRYSVAPRGVSLVIGCATFPNWNAYPGLFASLATGNPVIVKPHPAAILPLAITVAVIRQTLKDAGFDANLVSLLVDTEAAPIAKDIALKPDIRIIDYSGGADFGAWLEGNARQAQLFMEKTAVDSVVVDSTDNYPALLDNLALTLCLYSGQLVSTPRLLLVPRSGVQTPSGHVPTESFGADLAQAIGRLLEDAAQAVETLGAIQSRLTLDRIDASAELGEVVRPSVALSVAQWPNARVRTPLLMRAAFDDTAAWLDEHFGPIAYLVETATTAEGIAVAERVARERGGINLTVHSTNEPMLQLAEEAAQRAGVTLTVNPAGGLLANQSEAFSDFFASGANVAANACRTDTAFVARRFLVFEVRTPAA